MEQKNTAGDVFAEIAENHLNKTFKKDFTEKKPKKINKKYLSISNNKKVLFKPSKESRTKEEIDRKLNSEKNKMAQYLKDFSPETKNNRSRIDFNEFQWRIQTEDDKANFDKVIKGEGDWQKVNIPHYDEPYGKAVTYYQKEFEINELSEDQLAYICFKGADYIAHVFINHNYAGSHEGFFAPFEFPVKDFLKKGKNILTVKLENDAVMMGNNIVAKLKEIPMEEGDKLYAATGPGVDEPYCGWHHCPPAMGLYQKVYLEMRPKVFLKDIFVRPFPDTEEAEIWVETYSNYKLSAEVNFNISIFGQNFKECVFKDKEITENNPSDPGINYYRFKVKIPEPKIWDLDTPWLYKVIVSLGSESNIKDSISKQFGMRKFILDESSKPKGDFYLNNRKIKLKGANTMGYEQQDVMRNDFDQLIDDILYAKVCNMNFLRLTQRPVQEEIYEYCDKLGLMTQTDLPLFGVLRRNMFDEAVRQSHEMERLIRSHPCNVINSFINEPFPNAKGKMHRHLSKPELVRFFENAINTIKIANPDRVIKPVDGDYDPPSPGLPDNHCYCGWYNGHGIDIGKLNRGYWIPTKKGWNHGCGEFGAEGLEQKSVMDKYYPKEWLPKTPEEEKNWSPDNIVNAQSGRFQYLWFEKQHTVEDWIKVAMKHQYDIVRLMTEAFRRDNQMVTYALHLFIDAFPAGWMKTIMDVDRNPKPGFFAYKNALDPLMISLRTDKFKQFSGDNVEVELWVCNDTVNKYEDYTIKYQAEIEGEVCFNNCTTISIEDFKSECKGILKFPIPEITERKSITVRAGLFNEKDKKVYETDYNIEAVPSFKPQITKKIYPLSGSNETVTKIMQGLKIPKKNITKNIEKADLILVDDYKLYQQEKEKIEKSVEAGKRVVFFELPQGENEIFNEIVNIEKCGMNKRHFVSRQSGHQLVKDLKPDDFKFWYDESEGYITPFLNSCFISDNHWKPVLKTGNGDFKGKWTGRFAAAERKLEKGSIIICQVELKNRIKKVPAAKIFAHRLIEKII